MSQTATPIAAENYGSHPETPSPELRRFFSRKRRALMSLRDDGSIYSKSLTHGWKLASPLPEGTPVAERIAWFKKWQDSGAWWQSTIRDIPTLDELEQQIRDDGSCETPTGEFVEPDGEGSDGVPSWLRIFGLI